MKKKILKISLVFISLIVICLVTLKVINYLDYKKSIKGEQIDDYIYHYTIKGKEEYYIPVKAIGENIYFFDENDGIYTLYKRNIRNEKDEKIGTIEEEQTYCFFADDYILCSNDIDYYYDYKLNLLYSRPYKSENIARVLHYNGKFLTYSDFKLYDGDKVIKEFDFDDYLTQYSNDIIIGDNAYIVFYKPLESVYYYYDIKNDKFESQPNVLWSKYDEGFYSTRSGQISIYNVLTNEYKEYTDLTFDDGYTANKLKDNIFFFVSNNQIYMINLEDKTISVIDHVFDKNISQLEYINGYLYVFSIFNDCDVYLIDLNKVSKTTYTHEEYKAYMNSKVEEKIKSLEDTYHVDIRYDASKLDNETFKAEQINNNYVLLRTLDEVEKVLNKFNSEFFDKFYEDNYKGIVIHLTGTLTPKDGVDTTSHPIGYTISENYEYGVVMDANASVESTLCHELMHNIEHKMSWDFPYEKWYSNNPYYYQYMYTYTTDADYKFTMSESDRNKVHFVDTYSKSYPTEDIARIFENICDKDETTYLLDYPHLKDKAMLLKEALIKYFPSLEDASVFDSLKETIAE